MQKKHKKTNLIVPTYIWQQGISTNIGIIQIFKYCHTNILILHSCRATQSRGWEKLLHDNFLLFVVGDGALWHNRLNIDTIVPMHQVKGNHKMVFNI